MVNVPKLFYADRRSAGATSDAALTHQATQMLRRVARDLRLRNDVHEIVAEPAGRGRGCRVTLRTNAMMLEVADSPSRQRVAVSFRTRRGRNDLSGGVDNVVPLEQLASQDGYEALLGGLRLVDGLDHERR
ncbi:TPA: hypothetical protein QDA71_002378 [Burkholderia vietnamiensis]|uniref:hypothetical protein n=1 Tax=Burkholderia vietnamiensis TaxID=60552 RepID=UPI0007593648|nr:hypothetical protein [Burkholderia vietnamiensis]KVS21192.1 hypothetical protein WK34_22715 [Burkholderia vietnamiensis]MBR7912109.1 hypothetical protein [Burkholderia vietnamiensis]MBR8001796.1 hypothetical protein [Burkholderia vietnamiensis]MBR8015922.1 hypothetical protein [Burkholderia vietnamiensis]MCA7947380.1 hypothetical protein [Burkholderia vietnamiensis]